MVVGYADRTILIRPKRSISRPDDEDLEFREVYDNELAYTCSAAIHSGASLRGAERRGEIRLVDLEPARDGEEQAALCGCGEQRGANTTAARLRRVYARVWVPNRAHEEVSAPGLRDPGGFGRDSY